MAPSVAVETFVADPIPPPTFPVYRTTHPALFVYLGDIQADLFLGQDSLHPESVHPPCPCVATTCNTCAFLLL